MKKRTIKAGKFQRHYATNGILMYRERKLAIEIPEGTLVEILKARRQTHLCSVRCIVADAESGQMALGSGKKAEDTCIAIPVDCLPKMKIEGAAPAKGKGKGKGSKGTKAVTALPVVAIEGQANQPEVAPGVAAADIAQPAEQPAPQAEAPAPAPEVAAPAAEQAPVEAAV